MMQIAFYKGEGGLFNKVIRLRTGSQITHVELIINGIWYSASHTDGGVRSRIISGNSGNWDIYDLEGFDEDYALQYFTERLTLGYDWVGIFLSQALRLGVHCLSRYFCSEIVGGALSINDPHKLAPHELLDRLNKENKLSPVSPGFFTP